MVTFAHEKIDPNTPHRMLQLPYRLQIYSIKFKTWADSVPESNVLIKVDVKYQKRRVTLNLHRYAHILDIKLSHAQVILKKASGWVENKITPSGQSHVAHTCWDAVLKSS